jgi:hypothetical protein
MADQHNFTIRIREATVQVCRAALAQAAYPEDSDKGIVTKDLKGRVLTTGVLKLNVGEALVLQEIVADCAHHNFREGSELHNEALMFAGALDDRCRTQYHDDIRLAEWAKQRVKDFEAQEKLNEAVAAANKAEAQEKALRDAMLGEAFLGGPRKRLNIWGQIVEEPPLSKEELRARAKSTTPEDWRKAAELDRIDRERERERITKKMGAAMQYKSSTRIKLNANPPALEPRTKPIADVAADQILTKGSDMDYNEDMKRVGTQELINEGYLVKPRYKSAVHVADGVVGTVSSFAAKPR